MPLPSSKEWAVLAARAASDKRATDIVAMDVAELLVVTDYFVICTGNTDVQVKAIADEVEDRLRMEGGIKPIGREGREEGKWVLLDFGDLVIHVFQPGERDFYRLEKLWADAPRLTLPADVTGDEASSGGQDSEQ
ncbi:MAG TPA: ribosome silencing factor [Coriobacteriia bacterium]|nr:ribosome silencing factor [Coriobacteriia bacterium]